MPKAEVSICFPVSPLLIENEAGQSSYISQRDPYFLCDVSKPGSEAECTDGRPFNLSGLSRRPRQQPGARLTLDTTECRTHLTLNPALRRLANLGWGLIGASSSGGK